MFENNKKTLRSLEFMESSGSGVAVRIVEERIREKLSLIEKLGDLYALSLIEERVYFVNLDEEPPEGSFSCFHTDRLEDEIRGMIQIYGGVSEVEVSYLIRKEDSLRRGIVSELRLRHNAEMRFLKACFDSYKEEMDNGRLVTSVIEVSEGEEVYDFVEDED